MDAPPAVEAHRLVVAVMHRAPDVQTEPARPGLRMAGVLNRDENYVQVQEVHLPERISGPYYVTVLTDALNNVYEFTFETPGRPQNKDGNNYGSTATPIPSQRGIRFVTGNTEPVIRSILALSSNGWSDFSIQ